MTLSSDAEKVVVSGLNTSQIKPAKFWHDFSVLLINLITDFFDLWYYMYKPSKVVYHTVLACRPVKSLLKNNVWEFVKN